MYYKIRIESAHFGMNFVVFNQGTLLEVFIRIAELSYILSFSMKNKHHKPITRNENTKPLHANN